MANLVSQAEFARLNGWARSYVTQLKHEDRLVLEQKGRRDFVVVDASLDLIAKTTDNNRDDVKKRWEVERGNEVKQESEAEEEADKAKMSYQVARTLKETYAARKAKMEYEREIGKLVDESDVKKAGFDLGTHLRTSLENLQDQLTSELAPETDPAKIYELLGEHFEYTLSEISRKLNEALVAK